MGNHQISLPPSALDEGQVKAKPKKLLAPGVVKRLNLHSPLDVAITRTTVRKLTDEIGYSLINQVRISSAVFEVADHLVTYAGQGEIVIFWHESPEHNGLKFFCNDQGLHAPKLTDFYQRKINQAQTGLDILSPQRLVDAFEFTEDQKHGNCINMSIWLD